MSTWYDESCPACGATNWINNGDEEDLTVMDVDEYTCWKCGAEIRMSDGELAIERRSHVKGTGEGDDLCHGAWVEGLEAPR